MNSETVAVIVTYNRQEMLLNLVATLQVIGLQEIVIIDNYDKSSLSFNDKNILHIKTQSNIGGAGGYNLGIKNAISFNPKFIWLLDDDSLPDKNTLNFLIEDYYFLIHQNIDVSFVCSKVLWGETQELCLMNIPNYSSKDKSWSSIKSILSCSFVSVLIPTAKIKKIGLPIKEYFIWYDDVEFTKRLTRVGKGYIALNSEIKHYPPQNIGANYRHVNNENILKYQYGFRNMISYHLQTRSFKKIFKIFSRVNKEMSNGNVSTIVKLKVFYWGLKGLTFSPKVEYYNDLSYRQER